MPIFILFAMLTTLSWSRVVTLPGENVEREINDTLELATDATEIQIPEGKFYFENELLVTKPGITIRGAGMEKTIISFKKQKAGPQGILATKDRFKIEELTVEDTAGNGIKVIGANNVQFIRVRVRWSSKGDPKNGAYGVYPVLTKNVLIENCDVSDASDAGIYVGQSTNIIVRGNDAHHNVAGIEIENSNDADVYDNRAHHNTAGILVFNLPDLVKKDGVRTRVHHNDIYSNNHKNFSTKGSIINMVPRGLGYFTLAAQRTEISHNRFRDHRLSHIILSNYMVSERPIRDSEYDPMPRGIFIHSNDFGRSEISLPEKSKITLIIKLLAGPVSHDIIYDGIFDGTYAGEKPSALDRICIGKNKKDGKFRFANLHLDFERKIIPIPGRLTRSLDPHSCEQEAIVPKTADLEAGVVTPIVTPSQEEILRACKKNVSGTNWGAVNYDCPELSDFRLSGGVKYELTNELFTDYALKERMIYLPPGTAMDYAPKYALDFPVGTIITKTFTLNDADSGKEEIIETRLLVHRKEGWVPLNYAWKDGKAKLERAGFVVTKKVKTSLSEVVEVDYHVPSLRQCLSCHQINDRVVPIGPRAKFLNTQGQLESWAQKGILKNLPTDIPTTATWHGNVGSLDERAKAYLEINCTHCHSPKGNARNTGLFFSTEKDSSSVEMGTCKTPVAAGFATGGNFYDIQPGSAEKSILYFRLSQNHLAVKMPQLGRSTVHKEGNALIKKWIDEMPKVNCKNSKD